MRTLASIAFLLALPLHSGPSPSAENPPTDESISRFAELHVAESRTRQLGRWRKPVCPQTLGLDESRNALISSRIREVAQAASAPLKEPCDTNVRVVFTATPQKVLDQFAGGNQKWMLGADYGAQAKQLA